MKVIGAAYVVTGNEGDERSSSIGASWLQTAQSIGSDSALGSVTVTSGLNTSVHTLE